MNLSTGNFKIGTVDENTALAGGEIFLGCIIQPLTEFITVLQHQ